uniref:Uncharacterized protein n=1 Tax=Tanacetum cinerariifolium TaxID=118510 RepID=A0A6L2MPQ9_TANCI|nr:hypothetical protein [Tanacetum cinerariifolium]
MVEVGGKSWLTKETGTTISSLEAEQDSGNIDKTQSKATPNESSSSGITSGGGPRCQEAIRDTIAQTRVLNLEKIKTTQALEITSLKRRVKKVEKKQRSRTHKLKRLYKVFVKREVDDKEVSAAGEVNAASIATTKMFNRAFNRVNTFVDFKTELVDGSSKIAGEELTQESAKKQKVDNDKETAELKKLMEIITNEEEVIFCLSVFGNLWLIEGGVSQCLELAMGEEDLLTLDVPALKNSSYKRPNRRSNSCYNGTVVSTEHAVVIALAQKNKGSFEAESIIRAASTRNAWSVLFKNSVPLSVRTEITRA